MATTEESTPAGGEGGAYRWYVVVILLVIYSLNQLDRTVVNILGESIKRDLAISDTQLGLLTGTSFAIFYSLLGLPMAHIADRWRRVNLIGISLLVWSALTACCGLSANFVSLFLLRMGVGVGEAGGTPPSQSLIADYFSHRQRSTAIALFNSGVALGTFMGFLMGGWVNQLWGWRAAFVVAGAPGVLVAVLLKLTVKEPVRGAIDGLAGQAREALPIRETLRRLFRRRSYFLLVVAATCSIGVMMVSTAWLPPLFIRLHGFRSGQIGGWLALSSGLGGGLGSFLGGFVADRLKRRTEMAEVYIPAAGAFLTFPALLAVSLSDNVTVALVGMFALFLFGYVWIGPTSAMIHRVVPVRSRAFAIGFMLFFSNITAMAFGPPLVGAFSDALSAAHGPAGLRYALAATSISSLVSGLLYLFAVRPRYQADLLDEAGRKAG